MHDRTTPDGARAERPAWLDTLAHDLRGPLGPLLTGIGLLRSGRMDTAQTADLLDTMQRQLEQLGLLIDDTAELLRPPEPSTQSLDPASLLDMVSVRLYRRLQQAQVSWMAEPPEPGFAVAGDGKAWVRLLAAVGLRCAETTVAGGQVRVSLRREGDGAALRLAPEPAQPGTAEELAAYAARLSHPSPAHVADAALAAVLQRHAATLTTEPSRPSLLLRLPTVDSAV